MPDSYGVCFTGVGRERMVRCERSSIMTALATTNPISSRTGRYDRPMTLRKLREKFHKSPRRKVCGAKSQSNREASKEQPIRLRAHVNHVRPLDRANGERARDDRAIRGPAGAQGRHLVRCEL